MLINLPHPTAGTVPQIRSPMRFTEAELAFDRAPPLLGQHTNEVLAGIGYDDARIAQLARDGVI
jgi:crotonobetainyl-CoA:carnitine CoA-transferase CaiB-like acyl-CoA transferase